MSKEEGSSKERVSKEKDANIELMRKINQIYKNPKNAEKLEKIGINSPEEALERCMTMSEFIHQKNGRMNLDSNLDEILAFEGQDDNGDKIVEFFGTKKAQIKDHIADEIFEKNGFERINLDPNVIEKLGEGKIDPNIKKFSEKDLIDLCGSDGIKKAKEGIIKSINEKNGNEKEGEELQEKNNEIAKKAEMANILGISVEEVYDFNKVIPEQLVGKINETNPLSQKNSNNQVRENSGLVDIVRVKSGRATGPDRYYGLQNGRIVLFGIYNEINEDLDAIFNNGTQKYNGRIVDPIKHEEKTETIHTKNGTGITVNDNPELSQGEKKKYMEEMEKILDDYDNRMKELEKMGTSEEEKKELTHEFVSISEKIAQKYDVNELYAKKTMEDAEKKVHDDDYDEDYNPNGSPKVPGKREH